MKRTVIVSVWMLSVACGTDNALTTPSGAVATAADSSAAAPASSGSIGVAPCDAYVEKVTACLATMSSEEGKPRREALDKTIAAFRAQAGSPAGKEGLDLTCRSALASLEGDALCGTKK